MLSRFLNLMQIFKTIITGSQPESLAFHDINLKRILSTLLEDWQDL